MPPKISLIILCMIVLVLLAPYAGCKAGDMGTHTKSDEAAEYSEGHEESLHRGKPTDHNPSSGRDETLDGIDDLLAN